MHQNIHGPQNFTPLIFSINLSRIKKRLRSKWSTLMYVEKVQNLDSICSSLEYICELSFDKKCAIIRNEFEIEKIHDI